MVSRSLGATCVPTLNKLLTGTHLPGKESEPHFARRQYTATAFHTSLNPRDKFTSCPKRITLLGIQTLLCLLFDVSQIIHILGFPGGSVVKNPPANAGDTGSEPWSGKIPHAMEQLSPPATTIEPAL